jgi:UMF1 family MFS transporter
MEPTTPPSSVLALIRRKPVIGWAFYDWANSAFSTTVMAGFFPIFFRDFWSAGTEAGWTTSKLGFANAAASALVALGSPWLGALADQLGTQKRQVLVFSLIGALSTLALSLVSKGDWQTAIFLYVMATVGFYWGNSAYDSLLTNVTEEKNYDRTSALGFGLGYLGGGLLLALNIAMTLRPGVFGLEGPAQAVQWSFALVGIWWALFTLPLLIWVPETKGIRSQSILRIVRNTQQQLISTLKSFSTRAHRPAGLFLLAYFFYIDGVNTIIKMAVDYGMQLGFDPKILIQALLLVQFVAFPFALLFGWLAGKWGLRRSLILAIAIYILANVAAVFLQTELHFLLLAALIATAQGGIQSLSRSAFAQMVPSGRAAEWFGFFNMVGKASSIMGPLLVGVVAAFGSPQASILSILLLFILGLGLLLRVPLPDGQVR